MSRDVDRVIDYMPALERERFLPPVMAQVITSNEIERAAEVVRAAALTATPNHGTDTT